MRRYLIAALVVAGLSAFGVAWSVHAADAATEDAKGEAQGDAQQAAGKQKGDKGGAKKDGKKSEEGQSFSGILIDNQCGKDKNEEEAAKHPRACAAKKGCAESGYRIVIGEESHQLDDKGDELALAFLQSDEGGDSTRVTVQGELQDDGTIAVASIAAQEDEEGGDSGSGKSSGKSGKSDSKGGGGKSSGKSS